MNKGFQCEGQCHNFKIETSSSKSSLNFHASTMEVLFRIEMRTHFFFARIMPEMRLISSSGSMWGINFCRIVILGWKRFLVQLPNEISLPYDVRDPATPAVETYGVEAETQVSKKIRILTFNILIGLFVSYVAQLRVRH